MPILTASAFKTETLKILDDIFKHEYRRPKELNAEIHCANKRRNEEIGEESLEQTTEVG
jgi:hypothetical protein